MVALIWGEEEVRYPVCDGCVTSGGGDPRGLSSMDKLVRQGNRAHVVSKEESTTLTLGVRGSMMLN